jgi:hypothetical protein
MKKIPQGGPLPLDKSTPMDYLRAAMTEVVMVLSSGSLQLPAHTRAQR